MARLLFLQDAEYEVMGPMYLSAMLKAHGHRASLQIGRRLSDFRDAIESFQPDLVGFSVISGGHRWALSLARQVKAEYGVRNVFGGPHATFVPGLIREDGVDLVVKGEAEDAVVELLDRVDRRAGLEGIANVSVKSGAGVRECAVRNLRRDLDEYPFPDRLLYRDLAEDGGLSMRNVLTSRGCPFDCSFCFEGAMRELYRGKGKYVRIRRIDKVIEELRSLKSDPGVKTIFFCDDLFGMDKEWLYEFLPVYRREIGVPFVCQVRADIVASDPEYARALKDGLCAVVSMGVESGNERLRNRVLQKSLSDAQIVHAAEHLHDAGLPFRAYNVLGLPGETFADAVSTIELNIRIRTDYPWCALFTPLPGTRLSDYAVERGYLAPDFHPDQLPASYFDSSPLSIPRKREIENLHKLFQTVCLFPPLLPAIKTLARLPLGWLYRLWFCAVYFFVYLRSYRLTFFPTLRFALRNARRMLSF